MPLFVCDKCGCIENTALGRYWSKDMQDLWEQDNLGMALCSECAPKTYRSGMPTRFTGKWHNNFPKKQWDGKIQVVNRKREKMIP